MFAANEFLLDDVCDTSTAIDFVHEMLAEYGVNLFFDPKHSDTEEQEEGEDDLFIYGKDMVERFLLSLVFDVCEAEGDAEGLRALRRVMVGYFLGQKPERQDSKYASFTMS